MNHVHGDRNRMRMQSHSAHCSIAMYVQNLVTQKELLCLHSYLGQSWVWMLASSVQGKSRKEGSM